MQTDPLTKIRADPGINQSYIQFSIGIMRQGKTGEQKPPLQEIKKGRLLITLLAPVS